MNFTVNSAKFEELVELLSFKFDFSQTTIDFTTSIFAHILASLFNRAPLDHLTRTSCYFGSLKLTSGNW